MKEIDPELMTFEGEPERGISDAAINSRKYTALLAYYRLDNYSNSEIKEAIFSTLRQKCNGKQR